MLRLRLEVVASDNLNDICSQATRMATQLGIEVVFNFREQDFTAKPGMTAESCLNELLNKYEMPAAVPTIPAAPIEAKPAGKKGGKQKEQAPVASLEVAQPNVQEEGI